MGNELAGQVKFTGLGQQGCAMRIAEHDLIAIFTERISTDIADKQWHLLSDTFFGEQELQA